MLKKCLVLMIILLNDYPLSLGYSNDLKSIGRYDYYVHEQKKKKILSKKKRVLRRKYD